MRYKDEIRIGVMAACFCCVMVLIYAAVPKDVSVLKARSTSTFKEAPETAAEAQAQAESDAEDAGFTIYSQDSNYDYDTSSDTSASDSTQDTTTTDPDTTDTSQSSGRLTTALLLVTMPTRTVIPVIMILLIRSHIRLRILLITRRIPILPEILPGILRLIMIPVVLIPILYLLMKIWSGRNLLLSFPQT